MTSLGEPSIPTGAAQTDEATVRYIVSPGYALRGWKLLPFAIQHLYRTGTEFFRPDEFRLLEACDGQTDIAWASLTEGERERYEHWERGGFIRRAKPGDRLLPHQRYRFSMPRRGNPAGSSSSPCWTLSSAAACTT